jgi:4-hydroxy-tetrahydrodipicolinate reductase
LAGIALLGATGKMGRAILPLLAASDDLVLAGALASPRNPAVGQDAGVVAGLRPLGVTLTDDPDRALAGAQIALDFTRAGASLTHARACARRGVQVVVGTTGHDETARRELGDLARSVAMVIAPNLSLGVNLLLRLAEIAAGALPQYDAEIFEAHHRDKVDAPSGTALALGEVVARARGTSLDRSAVYSRRGDTGARAAGAIGFSVLRAGDIVGEHRLVLAGPGERVELAHLAHDRSAFARGALAAARWLAQGRKPGLYGMKDVLGL